MAPGTQGPENPQGTTPVNPPPAPAETPVPLAPTEGQTAGPQEGQAAAVLETKKKENRDATQQELDKLKETLRKTVENGNQGLLLINQEMPESYRFTIAVIADDLSNSIFKDLETEYNALVAMRNGLTEEEFRSSDPVAYQEYSKKLEALQRKIKDIPQIFQRYCNQFSVRSNGLDGDALAKISQDTDKFVELLTDKNCEEILKVFKWALGITVQGETGITDADAQGYINQALNGSEPKQKEMAQYVLFIMKQNKRQPLIEAYLKQLDSPEKMRAELKILMDKAIISPMELEALTTKLGITLTREEITRNEEAYRNATDIRALSRAITSDSIGAGNLGDLLTGRNLIGFIGNISGVVSGALNIAVNAKTIWHDPAKLVELAPNLALSGVLIFNQALGRWIVVDPNADQVKVRARMDLNRLMNTNSWFTFFNSDAGIGAQAFADYLEKTKTENNKKFDPEKITYEGFKAFLSKPEYKQILEKLQGRESTYRSLMTNELRDIATVFESLKIKSGQDYLREFEASREVS